ncbi:RDD family protein [bacterium]|nr:RDD family protein [bacterium]
MQKGGKFLCMGCNHYFPRREVELVEGVAFCASCQDAKAEFIQNRLRQKAEKAAPQALGYATAEDEAKWEASFDTSQMISVSTGRARRLKSPIEVKKSAGFFWLMLAAVIDLVPVGAFLYWSYSRNPQNGTWWTPDALLVLLGVLAYRILFTLMFGKSIGMALAGIRPVGADGRPVGLLGSLLHGALFILGRVVTEADWKRAAARAVYFAERRAQANVKVEAARPGPLGLGSRKVEIKPSEPAAAPSIHSDPWSDPDWTPPQQNPPSDPWNDPDWKPPPDHSSDPWNDPSR